MWQVLKIAFLIVSIAATCLLLFGLFLVICLPFLWYGRKLRLIRRGITETSMLTSAMSGTLEYKVTNIVFDVVANWIGVNKPHLRLEDRFDDELALTRWKLLEGIARSFNMDWEPVEEEIEDRLKPFSDGQLLQVKMEGSLGSVIRDLLICIDELEEILER